MYIPKSFEMTQTQINDFIEHHSFGMLVSQSGAEPCVTHLPLLFDARQNRLTGHVAKANPQWHQVDEQTVMAVFSGPHAYISPSWYGIPESVPTWNYVAVHVYGTGHVIRRDDELADVLARMVTFYDPESPVARESGEAYFARMMKAVVGFHIDITRMEGAAKLSQNKPLEVQDRVIEQLLESADPDAQAVAKRMQAR